jgi:hypothetical protein
MGMRAILLGAVTLLFVSAFQAQAGYKPEERYYGGADGYGDAPLKRRKGRVPYRDRGCCGEPYRFVYAESWYGFKQVVAPVRRAELGEQVRLPSGNWVYCEFSCEYTLRKQSLDFWEGATKQGDSVSPGIFRKTWDLDDLGRRRW